MRSAVVIGLAVCSLAALPARAQEANLGSLCAERPGLTTDACVMSKGRLQIETSFFDRTRERVDGERTDTTLIGDSLARFGIGSGFELRFAWTPVGIVRYRDADGGVSHQHRVGDVTIGAKKTLLTPSEGGKLAISVIASTTLPVGRRPIGTGDWGASLLLPISYSITDAMALQVTPVISAAVYRQGRHPGIGSAFGIAYALSDTFGVDVTGQVVRDDDGDSFVRSTGVVGNLAVYWLPGPNTQFDLGTNIGLNRAAPGLQFSAGIAHRF